jgi:hypothetical protein
VIELDLSGKKLSVTADDLEWLRVRAEKAAGASSGATELAARLAAIARGQRRFVFVRGEARALFKTLSASKELPPGLGGLQELLKETFAA